MRPIASLLALLALALAGPLSAQGLPQQPRGPVLDQPDVIEPGVQDELEMRLQDVAGRTGNALNVAIVRDIGSRTLEQYSRDLFDLWAVGGEAQNGVLLVVAMNEGSVRIQAGSGLADTVTEGVADRIIRQRMLPEFNQGRLQEGTLAGVDALVGLLDVEAAANDYAPLPVRANGRMRA